MNSLIISRVPDGIRALYKRVVADCAGLIASTRDPRVRAELERGIARCGTTAHQLLGRARPIVHNARAFSDAIGAREAHRCDGVPGDGDLEPDEVRQLALLDGSSRAAMESAIALLPFGTRAKLAAMNVITRASDSDPRIRADKGAGSRFRLTDEGQERIAEWAHWAGTRRGTEEFDRVHA